jgi:ATP-dependent RNA helicase RhlE
MPKTIAELAKSILTDPVHVSVAPAATTAERVEQSVMFVSSAQKQPLLETILRDSGMQRVLVFTRTKHGADKVVRNLVRSGIDAAAIHGNKSQSQRERALAAFKSGDTRVLVATDIAARGIHVENVTHVVNYDLPNVPESYVHRIGRTARAGAAGMAISFCNNEERAYLRDIEKLTRMSLPQRAAPAGLDMEVGQPADKEQRQPRGRSRQRSGRDESRRHHMPGMPGNKRRARKAGKPDGRSTQRRDNPRRERHAGGFDPTTGLPAFLVQAPDRQRPHDRHSQV